MLYLASPPPTALKCESPIERKILSYLERNPNARDTLRGIVDWWLLKQRILESKSEVEAAVESLVGKGRLSEHLGVDGQVSYSTAPKHLRGKTRKQQLYGKD